MLFHFFLSLFLHFRKTNHVCVRPTPPRISKATVFVHARQLWSIHNYQCLHLFPISKPEHRITLILGLPQWSHLFIYALVLELCANMHNDNNVMIPDIHQMVGLVHRKRLWSLRWMEIWSSPAESWAENLKNRN